MNITDPELREAYERWANSQFRMIEIQINHTRHMILGMVLFAIFLIGGVIYLFTL